MGNGVVADIVDDDCARAGEHQRERAEEFGDTLFHRREARVFKTLRSIGGIAWNSCDGKGECRDEPTKFQERQCGARESQLHPYGTEMHRAAGWTQPPT